jgi:IS30 family transposase
LAVDGKSRSKPGPTGMTAERASYVRLMKQGFSNSEICRTLGINRKTGTRWRHGRAVKDPLTGRVHLYPAITLVRESAEVISPRYLSEDERITIADRCRAGHTLRSIAAELGRAPSTISREIRRNRYPGGSYRPHHAQKMSRVRRQRPRPGKIARIPELREFIQTYLNRWWSPAQPIGAAQALPPCRGRVDDQRQALRSRRP